MSAAAPVMNNNMEDVKETANNNNNNNAEKGGLPSFSDILWSPDIDGDVMSHGIGGAMVGWTAGEMGAR